MSSRRLTPNPIHKQQKTKKKTNLKARNSKQANNKQKQSQKQNKKTKETNKRKKKKSKIKQKYPIINCDTKLVTVALLVLQVPNSQPYRS